MAGVFQPNVFQNNVFQVDSGAVVVSPTVTPPNLGGGGIASSTKRKPAVYIEGYRRARRELAQADQIKSFEELKRALDAMPRVAPEATPEAAPSITGKLTELVAAQPAINPADELRAKEIARQLQLMRDDDEAVALLLLN